MKFLSIFKDMLDFPFIVIIGSREEQKLLLIKDLISMEFDYSIIMVGNNRLKLLYCDLLPNSFIFKGFNSKIIGNFKNLEKNLKKLLIIDDCLYGKPWFDNYYLRDIILNRSENTMIILTFVLALPIPPIIRFQIDYVFLLEETHNSNRKRIYEQYGYSKSFEEFNSFLTDSFNNSSFVCLENVKEKFENIN